MEALSSLNTRISAPDKEAFIAATAALGLTPSSAVKVFVKKFIECKGFPFEVRSDLKVNLNSPYLLRSKVENGVVIAPAAWRDEDDD